MSGFVQCKVRHTTYFRLSTYYRKKYVHLTAHDTTCIFPAVSSVEECI